VYWPRVASAAAAVFPEGADFEKCSSLCIKLTVGASVCSSGSALTGRRTERNMTNGRITVVIGQGKQSFTPSPAPFFLPAPGVD